MASNKLSKRILERFPPPKSLTPEQAEEWVEIVDSMPANWFPRETHVLLVNLCRLTTRQTKIAAHLNEMESGGESRTPEYRDLLREEKELLKMIGSLCAKMRLTQLSTFSGYHKRQKMGTRDTSLKGKPARPWDEDEEAEVA